MLAYARERTHILVCTRRLLIICSRKYCVLQVWGVLSDTSCLCECRRCAGCTFHPLSFTIIKHIFVLVFIHTHTLTYTYYTVIAESFNLHVFKMLLASSPRVVVRLCVIVIMLPLHARKAISTHIIQHTLRHSRTHDPQAKAFFSSMCAWIRRCLAKWWKCAAIWN